MSEENKINVSFIIEILGRPKEHVSETLENLIKQLDEEKGTNVIAKTLHEPKELENKDGKPVEEDKKMFTSFADVEVEFDNLNSLITAVFKYMPSNIEINSPETFVMKNAYLGEVLTGIILRLHKYDEITKKLVVDNSILNKRLKEKQN